MTRYLPGPGRRGPVPAARGAQDRDAGGRRDLPRRRPGSSAAVGRIAELQRRAVSARAPSGTPAYNPGWNLCRDLRNMLIVSEAVARAALLRQESRGAHSRLDFPDYDDYWGEHNIVVRRTPDGMVGRAAPRRQGRRRSPRSSTRARRPSGHERAHAAPVARRRLRRRARRLRGRGRVGHGRARRGPRDPAHARRRISPCAGTARPRNAARAAPRSTAARG